MSLGIQNSVQMSSVKLHLLRQ